jgi:5-methylcytosine-specific restriction endonuclease McrA
MATLEYLGKVRARKRSAAYKMTRRRWIEANREKLNEQDRVRQQRYYQANPEKYRAYNRERYAANPEKYHVYNKAYGDAHREELNAKQRLYYAANREKCQAANRRWKEENRDNPAWIEYTRRKAVHFQAIRRAKTKETDLTPGEIQTMKDAVSYCPLCDIELTLGPRWGPTTKELDHIIPLAIGGPHIRANVRIICRRCNLRRPQDGSDLPMP